MPRTRVVVIGDLHCGHRVGLTHPDYQNEPPETAPHHAKKQCEQRRVLWNWFAERIAALRPIHKLIVNGDAIEGPGTKSGGVENMTCDKEEQSDMAAAAINFIEAESVAATYGTPYHVGIDADWENVVMGKVKNFQQIEAEGHYSVNGLEIVAKHFIGNTSVPSSRATALSNAQVKQMFWADRGQQKRANVIIRSHIHRCAAFPDYGANFLAITTPALMGLGSKYGSRQCDGLPVDFGFLCLDVEGPEIGNWCCIPHIAPLSMQRAGASRL